MVTCCVWGPAGGLRDRHGRGVARVVLAVPSQVAAKEPVKRVEEPVKRVEALRAAGGVACAGRELRTLRREVRGAAADPLVRVVNALLEGPARAASHHR